MQIFLENVMSEAFIDLGVKDLHFADDIALIAATVC